MAKSRRIPLLLIAVGVIVTVLATELMIGKRAEQKRQALYQSILRQYSTTLQPGTQRGEVEAALASRGRVFEKTCCLSKEKSHDAAGEEIVKIGEEHTHWYCRLKDVYLVFDFESPPGPVVRETDASDRLSQVALVPWPSGCWW
jgi:hypothetical protein